MTAPILPTTPASRPAAEPMTVESEARIRERDAANIAVAFQTAAADRRLLLAEVDRLRAEASVSVLAGRISDLHAEVDRLLLALTAAEQRAVRAETGRPDVLSVVATVREGYMRDLANVVALAEERHDKVVAERDEAIDVAQRTRVMCSAARKDRDEWHELFTAQQDRAEKAEAEHATACADIDRLIASLSAAEAARDEAIGAYGRDTMGLAAQRNEAYAIIDEAREALGVECLSAPRKEPLLAAIATLSAARDEAVRRAERATDVGLANAERLVEAWAERDAARREIRWSDEARAKACAEMLAMEERANEALGALAALREAARDVVIHRDDVDPDHARCALERLVLADPPPLAAAYTATLRRSTIEECAGVLQAEALDRNSGASWEQAADHLRALAAKP